MAGREIWQGYAQSVAAVKSGTPPFELAHGMHFYEYLAKNPRAAGAFFRRTRLLDRVASRRDRPSLRLGRFQTIMDVGGGAGSLLAQILLVNPGVRGILLDQAEAVALAKERFAAAGLTDRCQAVTGNFPRSASQRSRCLHPEKRRLRFDR